MQFDGKITIGLIAAIALETVAGLLWAGRAAQRLEALEEQARMARPVAERLARLEEQTRDIREALARIERKIEGERP